MKFAAKLLKSLLITAALLVICATRFFVPGLA